MDHPAQPKPTDPARLPGGVPGWHRAAWIALALAVTAYATLIYQKGSPFAAGSDSSGYLNSARLLARGEFTVPARTGPGVDPAGYEWPAFQPLGFAARPDGALLAPTYPIGLPLHLIVGAQFVGWEKTARVVNTVNVLAAGALLYAFGRLLGLRRSWALAGVALLWASPVWLFHVLQPMSDPLALTWSLAAMYGAWRARERWTWGFGAGAAFAAAVLVRPTCALLLPALSLALGLRPRAWLACGLAGLPGALLLGTYNHLAYGSALTNGYSVQGGLADAFSLAALAPTLRHYVVWIPLLLSVPLALAALALPWTERRRPALVAALGLWLLTAVAFYGTYYCAGETWWYLRFLLPAFPAVILAGLLAGQAIVARLPGRWRPAVPALALLAGLGHQTAFTVREGFVPVLRLWERDYAVGARWLQAHVPEHAIIVCSQVSGALYYYTGFTLVRADFLPPKHLRQLALAAAAHGRPVYAALLPGESDELLGRRLPAAWEPVGSDGKLRVWRLARPPEVPATAQP